jgi:hypothetical protein
MYTLAPSAPNCSAASCARSVTMSQKAANWTSGIFARLGICLLMPIPPHPMIAVFKTLFPFSIRLLPPLLFKINSFFIFNERLVSAGATG